MAGQYSRLESFILKEMAHNKIPGLSLLLLKEDEVVFRRGFGLRSLESTEPATPKTLYGIGSVTKTMTALAIMQLQEQGLLSVDDPIGDHLPLDIRSFDEPIRLRHLLSHSSGIPSFGYMEAVISHDLEVERDWIPSVRYEDILPFFEGIDNWVQDPPGERFFYSNEGYILLGAVIERVSGQTYEDYVRERILLPLDMKRSFFDRRQVHADADAAVPYLIMPDGKQRPGRYSYRAFGPAGGLISNVEDLSRYVRMYLHEGAGPHGAVISADSIRAMMIPHATWPQRTVPVGEVPGSKEDPPPSAHYGLGLSIEEDFYGHRLVHHGGGVRASFAFLAFLPDLGLAALVAANGGSVGKIARFALACMLDKDPGRLPFLRTRNVLEELCGVYETFGGRRTIKVKRTGDFLELEESTRHRRHTTPIAPLDLSTERSRFFTAADGERSLVEFTRQGDVTHMIFGKYKYRRVGPAHSTLGSSDHRSNS